MRRLKQNGKLKVILRLHKETETRLEGMKEWKTEVGSGKDNNPCGNFWQDWEKRLWSCVCVCVFVCACVSLKRIIQNRKQGARAPNPTNGKAPWPEHKTGGKPQPKTQTGGRGSAGARKILQLHTTLAVSEWQRDYTQILKKKIKKDQQDRFEWIGTVKIYLWWTKSSAY